MGKIVASRKIDEVSINIVLGDITEQDTDAIVNAANSYLRHGGGVAGAIARKGGKKITDESRRWVEENGPVPVGCVATTSGGNLKAKFVIHAVGPRWGEGNEDEKLRNAVRNSLKKASELNCRSIALPAISTGIFGFPKRRGVEIILKTILEFSANSGNIREVNFCNIDIETTEIARELLNSL